MGDPEIWGERGGRGHRGGSQPRCPQAQLHTRPSTGHPADCPPSLPSRAFCTWGSRPGQLATG